MELKLTGDRLTCIIILPILSFLQKALSSENLKKTQQIIL